MLISRAFSHFRLCVVRLTVLIVIIIIWIAQQFVDSMNKWHYQTSFRIWNWKLNSVYQSCPYFTKKWYPVDYSGNVFSFYNETFNLKARMRNFAIKHRPQTDDSTINEALITIASYKRIHNKKRINDNEIQQVAHLRYQRLKCDIAKSWTDTFNNGLVLTMFEYTANWTHPCISIISNSKN